MSHKKAKLHCTRKLLALLLGLFPAHDNKRVLVSRAVNLSSFINIKFIHNKYKFLETQLFFLSEGLYYPQESI